MSGENNGVDICRKKKMKAPNGNFKHLQRQA